MPWTLRLNQGACVPLMISKVQMQARRREQRRQSHPVPTLLTAQRPVRERRQGRAATTAWLSWKSKTAYCTSSVSTTMEPQIANACAHASAGSPLLDLLPALVTDLICPRVALPLPPSPLSTVTALNTFSLGHVTAELGGTCACLCCVQDVSGRVRASDVCAHPRVAALAGELGGAARQTHRDVSRPAAGRSSLLPLDPAPTLSRPRAARVRGLMPMLLERKREDLDTGLWAGGLCRHAGAPEIGYDDVGNDDGKGRDERGWDAESTGNVTSGDAQGGVGREFGAVRKHRVLETGAALRKGEAGPDVGTRNAKTSRRRDAAENMHPNVLRGGLGGCVKEGSEHETWRERAVGVGLLAGHGGRKALGVLGGAVKAGGRGNRNMQGLLDRAHALLARGDQRL